ncbi:hypothetical protein C7M84_021785 [Penaeus vannamei]|uniref:Transmembrane protein 53 n=1 Tax=Penaeus vannamei TaxID=6689 RepID=A0A3R7PVJ4_PENVA|nr:hypothetical protein C7M84_021785 [Penaeus vannamei]
MDEEAIRDSTPDMRTWAPWNRTPWTRCPPALRPSARRLCLSFRSPPPAIFSSSMPLFVPLLAISHSFPLPLCHFFSSHVRNTSSLPTSFPSFSLLSLLPSFVLPFPVFSPPSPPPSYTIRATLPLSASTTKCYAPAVSLVLCRDFHALRFSRNMEFFTSSDAPLPKKTMEFVPPVTPSVHQSLPQFISHSLSHQSPLSSPVTPSVSPVTPSVHQSVTLSSPVTPSVQSLLSSPVTPSVHQSLSSVTPSVHSLLSSFTSLPQFTSVHQSLPQFTVTPSVHQSLPQFTSHSLSSPVTPQFTSHSSVSPVTPQFITPQFTSHSLSSVTPSVSPVTPSVHQSLLSSPVTPQFSSPVSSPVTPSVHTPSVHQSSSVHQSLPQFSHPQFTVTPQFTSHSLSSPVTPSSCSSHSLSSPVKSLPPAAPPNSPRHCALLSRASLPRQVARALGERERPLTLLFCWLMAKERHVRKYAQLYTNLGIDVLKVRVSPFDLLRPTKGSQVAADQVLQFLHANPSHSPVLIHGFSVGGYVFSEVMVKVENDFKKHGHLLNRFVGQIWDSGVDIDGIPDGMPRAITNNALLQKSMKKYLEWYLKIQYDTATIHYERASQKMHQNFVGVPGLFLFSDNDPVSTPEMNARVYKKWEAKGHQVYTGHWQKSPHVTHFQRHPVEYQELMVAFLERVGMIEPARQRATSI